MQNTKNNVLSVKNLSKKYANFTAVDDISFDLLEGEILGFLGPNGAGKTTTIAMLLDLLTPTSGQISYFGLALKKYRSQILQQVSFASAYLKLPGSLTVQENLNFWAQVYGLNKRAQKEYIDKNLKFFGLTKLQDNLTRTLSAGELTRVMLAKAFLPGIKVVLLDEPTAALDPEISQQIREFILTEVKQLGISIIFTSHNMQEVEQICDRLLILKSGKIIASETPQNLISRVRTCHVQLVVSKNLENLVNYLDAEKNKYTLNKNIISIDIDEEKISNLFVQMALLDINYLQVAIDKPNLEDFFLLISKNQGL